MPDKIGQVNALSGTAVALSSNGESRILTVGSPVYKGEQIQSGPESALVISLDNGQTFDMGRNLQLSVDSLLSDAQSAGVESITQPATVDVEAVQQAILEGLDPSELTSPAAGAGAEPSSEGSHKPVYVDYLAPEVIPESGFDTTGVNVDFLDPLVDTVIRGEGSTSDVVGDNNITPPNDDDPTVPGDDDDSTPGDGDDPPPR
ncbi:MAG: retention module-containing protein [Methylophaga sp.]|nr:retention module-containing protein [Methylophaga sp.]